jgi:uncharacterized protein (DUF2147 family)
MKNILFTLILSLFSLEVTAAEEITGFWKTVDDQTGKARCIIAIYEHEGFRFGRIIGTFDDKGNMKDSIYKPVELAPGVVGDRYYSGLDIIWWLEDAGQKFKGKILDPEKGKLYNVEIWKEWDDLIVRGKLGPFGRNQTWLPAQDSDFPKDFKKVNLKTITPDLPQPR